MKKLFILLVLIPLLHFGQDSNGCFDKPRKDFICGNITEQILPRLVSVDYEFNTTIEITLKSKLKKERDRNKAEKVIVLINQVLNDSDFWKALEHYDNYQFAKWSKNFNDIWQEISKSQITNSLLNGHPEDSSRLEKYTFDIKVKLYGPTFKTFVESAVAKEVGDGIIYNKRWFYRKNSIETIASNWVHEISHSKGLRHCFNCDENRDYSVPYTINRIFKEVAQKYK